ncbi:hypothetical protein [Paraburkholderia sediminicola]|uniref:hypothetical protein n=1 Tax=Paraburkholderia sediminicola TaxID=458836 RepID=UPI0038BD0689
MDTTSDNSVSFAIISAHQFLGVSQHDVAVPVGQLDFVGDKIVFAGATRDALKATLKFGYTKVKTVPVARKDFDKR